MSEYWKQFKATARDIIGGVFITLPTIAFGVAQLSTQFSYTVNPILPLLASGGGQIFAYYYVRILTPKHTGISIVLLLVQSSLFTAWTVASYLDILSILNFLALTCVAYAFMHLIAHMIVLRRIPDEELGLFTSISKGFCIVAAGLRDLVIGFLSLGIGFLSLGIGFLSPMPEHPLPSSSQVPSPQPLSSLPSSSSQTQKSATRSTRVSASPPPYYDFERPYDNSLSDRQLRETSKL